MEQEPQKPDENSAAEVPRDAAARPPAESKPAMAALPPPAYAPEKEKPPVEGAAPKPRRGFGLTGAVALVALAAFGGAAIARYLLPDMPGAGSGMERLGQIEGALETLSREAGPAQIGALRSRIDGLEQKLLSLPVSSAPPQESISGDTAALELSLNEVAAALNSAEARLAALEASGTNGTGAAGALPVAPLLSPGEIAKLSGSIEEIRKELAAALAARDAAAAALEGRLTNLEGRAETLAPKIDLVALEARLLAIEADASGRDAKRAAATLALAGLVRAAGGGAPFMAELSAARSAGLSDGDFSALEPLGATGIRPSSDLLSDFDAVARAAVRADRAAADGWFDRLIANLMALFLVRRRGEIEGMTAEAIVARAEIAAEKGDLAGAAQEMAGLTGAAGEAVSAWRAEAEARLKLDRLLTEISERLIAAEEPPPGTP